jgi:hypothetical protein
VVSRLQAVAAGGSARVRLLAIALSLAGPRAAFCQADYYNLDAARPTRIEDAVATGRNALDMQFAPFRLERLADGSYRWRTEPKLAYGVLPFTELEVRAPFLWVRPVGAGTRSSSGFASFGVSALRAFNLETSRVPALALSGELLMRMGNLSAPKSSYSIKGLATKTTGIGRWHLNAAVGTYAVIPPRVSADTVCSSGPRIVGSSCPAPPVIIDTPCDITPARGTDASITAAFTSRMLCGGRPASAARAASVATPTHGGRWMAGLGYDHTFPLRSTLVAADLVAERFIGLFPLTDWTAEVGMRRQMTPQVVLDAGLARHFAGAVQSSAITFGLTYVFAVRPLTGSRADGDR